MKKLVIVSTVPMTLKSILKGLPRYLSHHYDVEIITSYSSDFFAVEDFEGVRCHQVNMTRGISIFHDIKSLLEMLKVLREIKPDIIHSYTPKAGLISMVSARLLKVDVRIHTFTGLVFPTSPYFKRLILKYIDRLICYCATDIVPEGEGVKSDLVANNITRKKLFVIGNGNISGIDTDYFCANKVKLERVELCRELNLPEDTFRFCYVGRLTQDKGIQELFDAFITLPTSAVLILVGSQDSRAPLSESLVEHLNNHPRVIQVGWLEDIRAILCASSVLVLPSYREGFPNTPLQAGSLGLPSIVSNINGCNEIVREGYNGWLVKPKCVSSLFNAMNEAMESKSLVTMGINARENVVSKYEQSHYRVELLKFYKRVLND